MGRGYVKNRPESYFDREAKIKTHEQMMQKLQERTGKTLERSSAVETDNRQVAGANPAVPTNRAEAEALLPRQGRQAGEAVNESPRLPKEGSIPSGGCIYF